MQRILWTPKEREDFFHLLAVQSSLTWPEIARLLHVHPRTLCDWRIGHTRMPFEYYFRLKNEFELSYKEDIQIIDDNSHRSVAGREGALKRLALYGPPGTPEGRRKGGLKAMQVMRANNKKYIFAKPIHLPQQNEMLAEFIGIMLGDGNLSQFQTRIFGCQSTDHNYKCYVSDIGQKLFRITNSLKVKNYSDCWEITFSSIELTRFLETQGLQRGKKKYHNADIPLWIKINTSYTIACIRGLFDTDGCIYLDRQVRNEKVYLYLCIAITSYIPNLLRSIYELLKCLGFSPTISNQRNILIRRTQEVYKFFNLVQPSNEKHLRRYKEFLIQRGEVG